MVDEIIVNRGILKTSREPQIIDGVNIDDLSRLAFRYYKMIIKGESPLDIDGQIVRPANSANRINNGSPVCLSCGSMLEQDDIDNNMPVCPNCLKKIRIDYNVLRELFG